MSDENERSVASTGSESGDSGSVSAIRMAIFQMSLAATIAYSKMEVGDDTIWLLWDSSVTDEDREAIKLGFDAERADFDESNCEKLAEKLLGLLERLG